MFCSLWTFYSARTSVRKARPNRFGELSTTSAPQGLFVCFLPVQSSGNPPEFGDCQKPAGKQNKNT